MPREACSELDEELRANGVGRHTLEDSTRPPEPEAKGQRTKSKGLGNVLGETEANEVVPGGGIIPVPNHSLLTLRPVEPGAASDHVYKPVFESSDNVGHCLKGQVLSFTMADSR
ncbi:MAG: hypothetical protein NTAFB01_19990 [Nitrospira sp.]